MRRYIWKDEADRQVYSERKIFRAVPAGPRIADPALYEAYTSHNPCGNITP